MPCLTLFSLLCKNFSRFWIKNVCLKRLKVFPTRSLNYFASQYYFQVMSCQVRSGQVRSGQVRSGQVKYIKVTWQGFYLDQAKHSPWWFHNKFPTSDLKCSSWLKDPLHLCLAGRQDLSAWQSVKSISFYYYKFPDECCYCNCNGGSN